MEQKDLQKLLEEEWQAVRKNFYFPQLSQPKLTEDVPNGQIDFSNLQITLNPKYLEKLAKDGCDEKTSLNAILSHEVGHFVYNPGSLTQLIRLHKIAREKLDEEKAFHVRQSFSNVQNNTNLVQNMSCSSIIAALKPEVVNAVGSDKIIFGLYQELWKKDLGVKLDEKEKEVVDKLKKIDYLNRKKQEQSFKEFIDIIKEHITGAEAEHNSNMCIFSEDQLKQTLKKFAKDSEPGEFEKTAEEILNEYTKKGRKKEADKKENTNESKEKKQVTSAGVGKGTLILAGNFYSALAENFSVPIRKKQLQENGSLYPYSHEEFSFDDRISDMDVYSSQRILPGITKKWIMKEGDLINDFSGIPNSVIIKDNSPSMTNYQNPEETVSTSVLGTTVISNAYLNNNAKVAVYIFGSYDELVGLTKDKEVVHKEIRKYSRNGGTIFNRQLLESYLAANSQPFDLSIISDMEINNLDDFVLHILKLPAIHRIHLLYTNPGKIGVVNTIAEKIKGKENVAIMPLISYKDIKHIVMGELKRSIR